MDLAHTLRNGCLAMDLKGGTKREVIEEMVDLLVSAGRVKERGAAVEAVIQREEKMSTGMQAGVAFPHGRTDTVDRLVTMLALKKEGVDFGSIDGQPARIFVMTLSPASRVGPHIEFLAEMGRRLGQEAVRTRVLAAGSVEEVVAILVE